MPPGLGVGGRYPVVVGWAGAAGLIDRDRRPLGMMRNRPSVCNYTEPPFRLSTSFWGPAIPVKVTSGTSNSAGRQEARAPGPADERAEAPLERAAAGVERAATKGRQPRADALRNVAKVLRAAEEVFSQQGLSAPVDEVARRAGVGVGTVYRHFPTKEALFEAIVMTRLEAIAEKAERLADEADPVQALFTHISELVSQAVAKKDLIDELARWGTQPLERVHAEIKDRLNRAGETLLRRAQAAGAIRSDLSSEDLSAMLMGTCEGASCALVDAKRRAEFAQRMVEVLCAGLLVHPHSRA